MRQMSEVVLSLVQKLNRRVGLMSAAEVCEVLGCHANTLYDRVRTGRLAAVRDGGKLKFDPAAIAAYIRARETTRCV